MVYQSMRASAILCQGAVGRKVHPVPQRWLGGLLVIVVLAGGAYAALFQGGDGTPANPYRIASAGQLIAVGSDPNLLDKHFILTADIDLSGFTFDKPVIASADVPFTGTLDAAGHRITNLVARVPVDTDSAGVANGHLGLVGKLGPGGQIKNFAIQNATITGTADSSDDKKIYGNTLFQWIRASIIIVAAVVLAKAIYWGIGKTVKRMAAKTRTRLDDILIDMLEEPALLAIIVFGIWYGLHTLTLSKGVASFIDKALYVVMSLNIAWLITRVFDALVEECLVPFARKTESDLDDHLIPVIRKGINISVWTIAIIMAMDNAGYDVFSILAGLGIGGLAFALAAQETVGNFFGGIAIFTDKPFKVGDRIQVRGHDGVVTAVGLRSTKIRTRYEGRIVTIPNSLVATADIVNVDTECGRQMFAVYRLMPDMDDGQITLAMDILRRIAEEDPDTEQKVVTGFFAITEYSRDIMLLYWIKPEASNLKTRTRINLEIVRRFKENNIELVKAQPIHTKLDKVELL
jgi:MscS family membrane protein